MRKIVPLAAFLVLLTSAAAASTLGSNTIVFKEQYYRLFRMNLNRNPDVFIENIFWLERALAAPFANPLFALALIENETQWEKYRHLFMMHLNIRLVQQYLSLGSLWNKREAFFFNAPFRDQNLASLDIAESSFQAALFYWEEALRWAELANDRRFRFINLVRVQYWEDQAFRIENGTLNYGRTITRELASLQRVREEFLAMENHFYVRTAPPDPQ
ncbi:MAG: hypothetical protein FWG66_04520 [Spirochaetes bacterium]|nr:hypothetical protein [Spirochaetota bacterium]